MKLLKLFLHPLFMAMVMMAMCPMKMWADDVASVKIGDETTNYSSITDAFNAAQAATSATVTLLSDYIFTNSGQFNVSLSNGDITLDLNDHTINGNASTWDATIGINGAKVTIVDKGVGLKGLVNTPGDRAVRYYSGSLTIEGGTFSGKDCGLFSESNINQTGKVTLYGGTFKGGKGAMYFNDFNCYKYFGMDDFVFEDTETQKTVKVPTEWSKYLSSKSVVVKPASEDNAEALVTVNGTTKICTFFNAIKEAMESANAEVKLLNDVEIGLSGASNQYCVEITKGEFTLDLNGKTIASSQAWDATFGISGANVTIVDKSVGLDGLISATNMAIFRYNSGKLTIEGGTFSGSSALKMENANLSSNGYVILHGGTFIGNQKALNFNNNSYYDYLGIGADYLAVNPSTEEILSSFKNAKSFSVKQLTVTLNNEGYATFSAAKNLVVSTVGVQVYKAVVSGDELVLTELEGYIPAGNGVLLYGGKSKAHTQVEFAPANDASAADMSGNELLATTQNDGSLASKSKVRGIVYALGPDDEFLQYAASNFIHNRAYLTLPAEISAKTMKFAFAETTVIKSVDADKQANTRKFFENGKLVIEKNGVKYNVMGMKEIQK